MGFSGLVERRAVASEERTTAEGKRYCVTEGALPVHVCDAAQTSALAERTHHYCGIFAPLPLHPLSPLAYVRLDHQHVEKVFINTSRRILLVSSDGRLATWRAAPTFESDNALLAGAPLVDEQGRLVSLVTARRGRLFAASNVEGDGGYFDTAVPWRTHHLPPPSSGMSVYGEQAFGSREELRAHVAGLPREWGGGDFAPVVHVGPSSARVALVAPNGRQLAHVYVPNVAADDVRFV